MCRFKSGETPEGLRLFFPCGDCDNTWVHYYNPESNEASRECGWKGGKPPTLTKRQFSVGTILVSIFWDMGGNLFIDYMTPHPTMNDPTYTQTLKKLQQPTREKLPGKINTLRLLRHANAPSHTRDITVDTLIKLGFGEISYPAYSSDLVPSYYHLFPKLKKSLKGK
jgi:Transposase (partial DDE domain)